MVPTAPAAVEQARQEFTRLVRLSRMRHVVRDLKRWNHRMTPLVRSK